MNTKFFTNKDNNTLFDKFEGIFKHNNNINDFDVLVGYFRSSGYFKLRPHLEAVQKIRILVGIDVDKITTVMQQQGLLFNGDEEKVLEDWQHKFTADVAQGQYDSTTEQGVIQFVEDVKNNKIQLKAHPSKKIHAKVYIFRPCNFKPSTLNSAVITGSSNLTDAGLGTYKNSNYEFNVQLNDYEEVRFATDEFERLWEEGVEILPEVVQNSLKKTHLNDEITPYELYLKFLYEYFGEQIDTLKIDDLPKGFKKLSYQIDAVHQGLLLLKKHNGFFLSDVVGLGKTVIATLIARQFWADSFKDCRILIVTPPAIKPNWQETFKKFDFNANYEIITNGSLDKVQHDSYDLVIVDEAHKFRNDTTNIYDQLQKICKRVTIDETGKIIVKKSKVILVSATPLNNKPSDIFNQVLLFQDKNQSTLEVALGKFFSESTTKYNEIKNKKNNTQEIADLYKKIRDHIISPLTVRRTRTDLINIKRYKKDLRKQKVKFPNIEKPDPIYYQLEEKFNTLFDTTLQQITSQKIENNEVVDCDGLFYARYQAIHFLKSEYKQEYKNADAMAIGLVGIMKTLLIKRMDSSFYAFKRTLGSFLESSDAMLKMIKNDKIIISGDKKIQEYILNDEVKNLDDLSDKTKGKDYLECKKSYFEDGFIEGVEHDNKILTQLVKDWKNFGDATTDPKLTEFNAQLPILLSKKTNPEQKIVIFTESADTMKYLAENIEAKYKDKVLSISGENRDSLKDTIRANFDANYDLSKQKNDYQIIITTDVLAEGVNLHRANVILNYDTPWNSTKLMQRIGRINRIGSTADNIYIHNFYPTEKVDNVIDLAQKAKTKMQGFHSALGEDSQIYSSDEVIETFGLFDENIENEDEKLIFLEEIKKFKKDYPEDYKKIKTMPTKVRNMVKNKTYQNGTLSFIRTQDKRSARFYFVKGENGEIENWEFIKTAKLLKCTKKTPMVKLNKLPERHYAQVLQSIKEFDNEQKQQITTNEQATEISTKDTNLVKQFLKPLSEIPNVTKPQKQTINTSIDLIEQGVFAHLSKQLRELQRQLKKSKITANEALLESVDITKKYLSAFEAVKSKEQKMNITPDIVISQSYV